VSSGADLFVVCKQCGSEVSPYVTECPYCGHRLRRRAPKLPRVHAPSPVAPTRQGLGSLLQKARPPRQGTRQRAARRSADSRWATTRPNATIAIVVASCVLWVATRAEPELLSHIIIGPEVALRNGSAVLIGGLHGDWWRILTAQFGYLEGGGGGVYGFVAILTAGLFGWLVERRHGPAVVLALFLGAGAAGALVAVAVYQFPFVVGANAGALALLAAWAAPDLRALRDGGAYEGDLLGAAAFAALLLAIPFVRPEASWLAGLTGGLVGLVVGLGLDRKQSAA
jgi:membrane associated rhomboid family serine protease